METRQIKLSLDTAKRLYEQGGEYRDIALTAFKEHELIGDILPKTWEEYCVKHGGVGDKIDKSLNSAYTIINRYVFLDHNQTQAYIAKMMLHLLRDEYRQGWLPDWEDENQDKYVILSSKGERYVAYCQSISRFLAFQDKKRANEFLTNFRELIELAGDLI